MAKPNPFRGQRGVALVQSIASTATAAEQTATDATTPDWGNVQNKPAEFPPEDHTHPVADLTGLPVEVTGVRNDPESALKNLLTQLAAAGIITNSTTAS